MTNETQDCVLIKFALENVNRAITQEPFDQRITEIMIDSENRDYFKIKLENMGLLDLGGAKSGIVSLENLIEHLGISDGTIVDPCNIGISYDSRIKSSQTDALSYLLKLPSSSRVNIKSCGLDDYIMPEGDLGRAYARRIVEEIYRVLPEGGIYFSSYSEPLEREARKIFQQAEIFPKEFRQLSESLLVSIPHLKVFEKRSAEGNFSK